MFEFNNIENFYGQDSPLWKDLLLSFGGVALGFGLSEFANWIRNNRLKERVGKSFQNEVDSLKPALVNQVEANRLYLQELQKYHFISPTIYIHKNLDHVKSLDRLLVAEYCKKTFGQEYLKKVRTIFNQLSVIETEIDRLIRFHENFGADLSTQYALYRENANKYTRAVADYFTGKKLKTGDDPFVDSIMTLTQETLFKDRNSDDIIQFQDKLHLKIIELEYGKNDHPLYRTITEFNQTGLDIISSILIKNASLIRKVQIITRSLENCYKKIYEQDFPTA